MRSGRYDDLSFLATGNMVHKLTARQSDKSNEPEVVNALREFEGKLGVNCRTSNADTKQSVSIETSPFFILPRWSALYISLGLKRTKSDFLRIRTFPCLQQTFVTQREF